MVFECQQCGECCQHMGQVHSVRETRGDFQFLISNQYTGEKNIVVIDPDKQSLFADKSIFLDHPEACPFLRYSAGDGKAYCTVHLTRPEICKDYGCWRLLILGTQGQRAGRVMYQRAFFSDNDELTRLWKRDIEGIDEPDDETWDKEITRILSGAGYTVRE